MLKTIVLLNFFVEKVIYFSRFFDEHKEQHLFEIIKTFIILLNLMHPC